MGQIDNEEDEWDWDKQKRIRKEAEKERWIKKERTKEIKGKLVEVVFLLMTIHSTIVLYIFRTSGDGHRGIIINLFVDSCIFSLVFFIPLGVMYMWVYDWLEEDVFGIVGDSEAYARLSAKYDEKFGKIK